MFDSFLCVCVHKMRFFMDDLGLRRLQLKKLVQRSPRILGNSVKNKIRPNVRGVSRPGVYDAFDNGLSALCLMVDNFACAWLPRTAQGLKNCAPGRFHMFKLHSTSNYHPLLTMMALVFRYQAAFLEDDLGVPRHRLKRMIVALPMLLSYSVEDNLRPKVTHVLQHTYMRRLMGVVFTFFLGC